MKRVGIASGVAISVAAIALTHNSVVAAAQRGGSVCSLAPLPSAFRLVGQGGHLGGVNGAGPTYVGGIGRQVGVRTATFADASTAIIVAVSGGTNAAGTAGTIELFVFNPSSGALTHAQTLTAPGHGNQLTMADINNDGVPDFALGAFASQIVYVFLSQSGTLAYGSAISLTPPTATYDFGRWLATGNLDQSGGDELIVAAPGAANGKNAVVGKVFVYHFNGSAFDAPIQLGTSGLALRTDDFFGHRVSVGDVDNNGWPDILVTAPRRDVNGVTDDGAVYVFLGPAFSAVSLLASSVRDDQLGNVIATDANGDFFGDAVVTTGAVGFNSSPRRAIVFTGPIAGNRTSVTAPDYSIAPANASLTDGWGTGLGSGDLNGDGIVDVLVGAPNASATNSCSSLGAAHIYISNASSPTSPAAYLLQPPALDPDWNAFGWSVTAVPAVLPDINAGISGHPGYLLAGEPGRDISGIQNAGNVYVYRVCSGVFPCP